MDEAKENKRMGRRVAIGVSSVFLLIILAWSILITIAVNNQPERITVDPTVIQEP